MVVLDDILSKIFMEILVQSSHGWVGPTGYPSSGYVPADNNH